MKTLLTLTLLTYQLTIFCQERKLQIFSQTSLNLSVVDLDVSEKFYTTVFGFESLKMPNDKFRSVKRWFKIADKVELHLELGRTTIIDKNYKKAVHIFYECPKEQFQKLEEHFNVSKTQIIFEKSTENKQLANKIYLNDPDGYVIEIKETIK